MYQGADLGIIGDEAMVIYYKLVAHYLFSDVKMFTFMFGHYSLHFFSHCFFMVQPRG